MLGYLGGAEQNVAHVARGLAARGHQCSLAFAQVSPRDPEGYARLFQEVAPCRQLGGEGEDWENLLARWRPEVIYLHKLERLPWSGFRPPLRAVRMVHDHDLCCPRRHKYYRLTGRVCHQRLHLRCWLDLAFLERGGRLGLTWNPILPRLRELRRQQGLERLLVASVFMRQELIINGLDPGRVTLLPPVTPQVVADPAGPAAEPLVLYVGQLIRGKGVDLLLRALARLGCPWRALLVGDGNHRPALERLAGDLGLGDRLAFAGWVPPERLAECYAQARLLAVPSRWPEPFGMIGIEAMQHGLPVVGFAVGGIPDWLRHGVNGLLCPEQDVAALAQALTRLLTDPGLARQMGREGRELALREYAFNGCLDRLEAILAGAAPETAGKDAPCGLA